MTLCIISYMVLLEVGKTSMLKKFLRTDLEAKDDIIRKYLSIKTCNCDDV